VLGSLLGAAGLTRADVDAGRARAEALACTLEDLGRIMASEFGQPIRDGTAPAHSPARLPLMQLVELDASQRTLIDLEGSLGKPATRGHIANLGETELELRFVGLRGEEYSGVYVLPASAVLDFSSWVSRRVEIAAPAAGAGRAQLLAQ